MDEGLGEAVRSCDKLGDGCAPSVEPLSGGWEGGVWSEGGVACEGGAWGGGGMAWKGGVWDGGGVSWEGVDVCKSSITTSTRSSRCAR